MVPGLSARTPPELHPPAALACPAQPVTSRADSSVSAWIWYTVTLPKGLVDAGSRQSALLSRSRIRDCYNDACSRLDRLTTFEPKNRRSSASASRFFGSTERSVRHVMNRLVSFTAAAAAAAAEGPGSDEPPDLSVRQDRQRVCLLTHFMLSSASARSTSSSPAKGSSLSAPFFFLLFPPGVLGPDASSSATAAAAVFFFFGFFFFDCTVSTWPHRGEMPGLTFFGAATVTSSSSSSSGSSSSPPSWAVSIKSGRASDQNSHAQQRRG